MKEYYSPIGSKSKSGGTKITIPSWVPLAKMYKFTREPNGDLVYSPVVQ